MGKLLYNAGKHYGDEIIKEYSKRLVIHIDKKYNERTLFRIKQFYILFVNEKVSTMSIQLTWSHYVEFVNNLTKIIFMVSIYSTLRGGIMTNSNQKMSNSEMNRILFEKYQNGNLNVRNEIIENNLIIVDRIAHTYSQKVVIPYEDLFQEGCCALIKAVDNYNISCGNNFVRYASLCIMRDITDYIKNNKYLVYIPIKLKSKIELYNKLKDSNLNDDEIRKNMKMGLEEFNQFLYEYKIIKSIKYINLKEKLNYSDEHLIVEDICVGNESINTAIDNIFNNELRNKLEELLNERELQIIYKRFGFDCDKMTRNEISKILKITESRVEQIEQKTLTKLRIYNRAIMKQFDI